MLLMKRQPLLLTVLFLSVATSCVNQYETLLRSTDYDLKFRKAIEYFEARKYSRTQPILEQLQMVYRGTTRDDTLQYYLGLSNYHLNDFVTAEDNFKQFVEIFPRSPFTKTARFLRLDCLFQNTYRYELDQQPSHVAIAAIEEFLYDYPGNEYTEVCRTMLDDLYNRLDRKAYESAKLYYTIEDYKAATHALKETLKDNPESSYREDILYYIVAANYHYANNSIPALQRERFLNLIDEYYNFISEYPDSRYRREMDTMFKRAQQFTTRNNN
ncbi:MAG: outer membrane protein assembly factor BamD [Bacteroidales bacterium]|jgi:outer membrane protein assembly factor BamD|nr:outer membrane protein assembly factor BamD [Bacteroidales bacterium]